MLAEGVWNQTVIQNELYCLMEISKKSGNYMYMYKDPFIDVKTGNVLPKVA